jgi:uncharacterized protein
MFEPRWYRQMMEGNRFVSFQVTYKETDLWVGIDPKSFNPSIPSFIAEKIKDIRSVIENYGALNPEFMTTLVPLPDNKNAHSFVQEMIEATQKSETGPMSAIAGLFAQKIGEEVVQKYGIKEIIIENGGDIYLKIQEELEVSVYAGNSPLSNNIALVIPPEYSPLGICTSSGTVGHSLSFGKADAAVICCRSAVLADAFATRFGNEVKTPSDINNALSLSDKHPEILSTIIIIDDKIGIKGIFKIKPMAV